MSLNNYEKTIGQALKKALTEEIYSKNDRKNSTYLPLALFLQGCVSKDTALEIKKNLFYTNFYTAQNNIYEELFEDYICNMITEDYVFCKKFGNVQTGNLYDTLSMDLTSWNIGEEWLIKLNGCIPNLVVKDKYIYFVDNYVMKRVERNVLCEADIAVISDSDYEVSEKIPHITEIVGDSNNVLYLKDGADTEWFYTFDINDDSIVRHEGNLIGLCNENAIFIRDGVVYALDEESERLLLEESGYETVWIDNDRIVVNYTHEKLGRNPFYIITNGSKVPISSDILYNYWWEYVVRRLYSKENHTEQAFHMKSHPSIISRSVIYGPWQLTPPEMSASAIIEKINAITAGNPDNRNVRLFAEMINYADNQKDDVNLCERMWELMVMDKGVSKNNGVFSENFVKDMLQKNIQAEEYNKEKMRGNADTIVHKMHLKSEPFEKIKAGIKTIELRVFDEKRQKLKIYDDIIFICDNTGEELGTTIVGLYIFPNFEDLYAKLPLLKCGYNDETIAKASAEDMKKYYPEDVLNEFNVVGIELRHKEIGEIYSNQLQRKIDEKRIKSEKKA